MLFVLLLFQHIHDRIMVFNYIEKQIIGIIEVPGNITEIQTIKVNTSQLKYYTIIL